MIGTRSIRDIIIQRIRKKGPISFHDFMEMALYYPDLGYYTSDQEKIGKHGDYYTSPDLTPAFGAMIARQLEQMWRVLGRKPFTIVEYGAGTGALCYDILHYLENNNELYEQLQYYIVEKSSSMREKERLLLGEKVNWCSGIQDLPAITGCIFSNELVDNFSVHRVVMQEELMEVFVGYENGFVECLQPASRALTCYLKELKVVLPKGFRTEINLEATGWIKEVATSLHKGFVMTIDYGNTSTELYHERRSDGTLLCYHKHGVNDHIYDAIGEQDITSHVNFSALCHWGFKNGLVCCGLTSMAGFLLALGFKDYLKETISSEAGTDLISQVKKHAFLTHTFLVDMGLKYKVLIQRKGIEKQALLGLGY